MADANKLFRKSAVEKLASPENLDQLIRITSPLGWLTLSGIIFLLIVAIIWGFTGTIPTTVQAAGILTRSGGIYNIQAPSDGIISSINVKPGDRVKAEEVVARLSQMDYLNQVKIKKEELNNLKIKFLNNEEMSKRDLQEKSNYYDTMIENIQITIEDTKSRILWLEEQLKNKQELYQRKLITKDNLLGTENELNSTRLNLQEKFNEINKVKNDKFVLTQKYNLDHLSRNHDVSTTELELQALNVDFMLNSRFYSPYEGRILDINNKEGNFINKGQSLMTLEKTGKDISNLKVVLYINPYEAKNIKLGMIANVSPSHVKQEEYGCILGLVTYIGPYPATKNSMMKELDNETLISSLSEGGAPYKFEVTLIPDPNTANGFKWTTQHGYPYEIVSGSLCTAQIVVQKQRPIELVIPIFKKQLLGIGNGG